MNIESFLPYLSIALTVCVLVGGYIALRSGYSKTAGETQQLAITALQAQNGAQGEEIKDCKEQIKHLRRVFAATRYGMELQGWSIIVNGEAITLIEGQAKRKRTVTIQMNNPLIDKQLESGRGKAEEEENNETDKQ